MTLLPEMSLSNSLRVLYWLRWIAILGQATALALAAWGLSLALPYSPMLAVVGVQIVWNLAVYWRLGRPWAATHLEISLNLVVDIAALSLLFYGAGGATNPFVSLYLMPIAIAAVALPYRYVAAISLLCVACYSTLMIFYLPLPSLAPQYGGDFSAHVLGMWVNFLISAALMGIVVAGIAGSLRQRDLQLAKAREEALNNERIVAMGTLSAGVSHEISTPLSTMTLLVDELLARPEQEPSVSEDLQLMKTQIDLCRQKIRELLDTTGSSRSEAARAMRLGDFVHGLLDRWRVMRPEIELVVRWGEPFHDPVILAEQTIAQSVANLLNNAADASVENGGDRVEVRVSSGAGVLGIEIDDQGRGIDPELKAQAGRISFSTKQSGFGIGLILSNASLGRFGGEVRLQGRSGGGTRTDIRLPIDALIIDAEGSDGPTA